MADKSPPIYGPDRETELGHLAASVGHHVINAFSAIVSNAEILKLSSQVGPPADSAAIADVIIGVSLKASSVSRRMIDFTRPSTRPGDEDVDLKDLVRDVVAERSEHAGSNIEWTVHLDAPMRMQGFRAHLRSMFDLLITNALEAIGTAPGHIVIQSKAEEDGWVCLVVEDDGVGMDQGSQEMAIEPFFTTKTGHLGVGLSLANGIWRRHGGTLSIQSQVGKGTSIRLNYNVRS